MKANAAAFDMKILDGARELLGVSTGIADGIRRHPGTLVWEMP